MRAVGGNFQFPGFFPLLRKLLLSLQPNCCNFTHGWLPLLVIFDDHHFGTSMPSGGHPPHQLGHFSLANAAAQIKTLKVS
jgi:hypothetical protein